MKAAKKIFAFVMIASMILTMLPPPAMAADVGAPPFRGLGYGISGGVEIYTIDYTEEATIDYVILPYGAAEPTVTQVKNHQDASGNPVDAPYCRTVSTIKASDDQYTAVLLRSDDTTYPDIVPDKYNLFIVAYDAEDHTTDVTPWRFYATPYSFEIKEHLTVTVKDNNTSLPIENASVKVGSDTHNTDINGQTTFDLSGGSYDCLIQAAGYVGQSTTHNALVQSFSWNVSLVEGVGGDYLATLHVEDDAGVKLKNAQITVDSVTKTADANGEAEFFLTAGSHSYTVSALGRTAGTGTFAVEDANMTQNITLYNSSAGVDVTINGHVEGQLRNELGDYLGDNCLDPSRVRSLTVNGADLNGNDFDSGYWDAYGTCGIGGLNSWYNDILTAIDLSGVSLDGNKLPDAAFRGFHNLTDIDLPASMTAIGELAFQDCVALESYDIPDGVTTLSNRLFEDCDNLAAVTIPASVTTIGEYLFGSPMYGSDGIAPVTDVNVSFSNPSSVTVNGNAFYNNSSAKLNVTRTPGNIGDYTADDRDGSATDSQWFGLWIADPLGPAPTIHPIAGMRMGEDAYGLEYDADIPFQYYYTVVADGAAAPEGIDTSGAGAEPWGGVYAVFEIPGANARDVYFVAKSVLSDSVSEMLKIDVPAADALPVDIVIDGHEEGDIANEINDALEDWGLRYNYYLVGALTVNGGTIGSGDASSLEEMLYEYYMTGLCEADFSGTSFEDGVVPDGLLADYDSLTTLALPGSVTEIGWYAFYGLEALESITLGSAIPPTVDGDALATDYDDSDTEDEDDDVLIYNHEGAVVYVPYGSAAAYRSAADNDPADDKWYGFTVVEIDTTLVSATVSPISAAFDKNPAKQADVTTTITWNSAASVTDVKAGGTSIGSANYGVSGNTLTVKKNYLAAKAVGDLVLTIEFDKGVGRTLTVTLSDSTPAPYTQQTLTDSGSGISVTGNIREGARLTVSPLDPGGSAYRTLKAALNNGREIILSFEIFLTADGTNEPYRGPLTLTFPVGA